MNKILGCKYLIFSKSCSLFNEIQLFNSIAKFMSGLPFIVTDYLIGKSIYPALRRCLNLLFSISITSFIFERFYFKYTWLDVSDYKSILDFVVKGYFFVPLSIFIIVHGLTNFLPSTFFSVYNFRKSLKMTRSIIEYEITKYEVDKSIRQFKILSKMVSPVNINKEVLIDLYLQFKDQLNPETLDNLQKGCEDAQKQIDDNFVFAFRALVAICIYFTVIPYFGWILFVLVLLVIVGYMIVLTIGYRFFDIIPTAVRKFHYEAEKYVMEYFASKSMEDNRK